MRWNRRDLMKATAISSSSLLLQPLVGPWSCTAAEAPIPPHLAGYADEYRQNPRQAALHWFRDAQFGLFVHYSIVSLVPGGKREVVQGKATLDELRKQFTAERFDAEGLTDLAVAAGMRYVNFTILHHGGPCLWRTKHSDWTSPTVPTSRDLVGEMAEACRKRKLGLFFYIFHTMQDSRPASIERNHAMFGELLTQYGPIAGTWLDSVHIYYRSPERFPRIRETFAMIRQLQPHCLISFKHGAIGEEDFLAPEHYPRPPEKNEHLSQEVKRKLSGKPVEICTTLQVDPKTGRGTMMWFNNKNARHRTADEVMQILTDCRRRGYNLLLNTGLRGDGSVHPADRATLEEVGKRIWSQG